MNNWDAFMLTTLYSGSAKEKLATARRLHAEYCRQPFPVLGLSDELAQLRQDAELLREQMAAMNLPALCSRCAASKGGGCCSAYMADNTDSLQIMINLLLGVAVAPQPNFDDRCCFLGEQGCLFLIKPLFCLNYNCTAIVQGADKPQLAQLYKRMGDVLSRQTAVESLLLDYLRRQATVLSGTMTPPSLR